MADTARNEMSIEDILEGVNYTKDKNGKYLIKTTPAKRTMHVSQNPHKDILIFIRSHPGCNVRDVARAIGITRGATDKMLDKLTAEGKIIRIISGKKSRQYRTYMLA